jgi:hypothetical protein
MSSSLKFKKLKNNNNAKNKINMIKNMTGMNDPAFQSNNTLKKYIEQKLNSYLEPNTNILPKTKSYTKVNDKSKFKIIYNIKNIYNNNLLSKQNKLIQNNKSNNNENNKMNSSSNSFNQKINVYDNNNKKIKLIKKIKRNSFSMLRFQYNKLLTNKSKRYENSTTNLNIKDNLNLSKNNNIINKTPNNIKKKVNKSPSEIDLNKKKSIFTPNKALGLEICQKSGKNKNKENKDGEIFMKKLYKNKTPKTPLYKKKSLNQMKILKDDINNILNNKTMNNNIQQLSKSYIKEDSKLYPFSIHNKLFNYKINYSNQNYKISNNIIADHNKTLKSKNFLLKDNINKLIKNDESFSENECPVPMPYVKKYSDNTIRVSNPNENINLQNILINKDLKEPKEETNVPLPISQPIKPNYFIYNNKKERRKI